MNWAEKLTFISDIAIAQFAAITTITAIKPIEEWRAVQASAADFDFVAKVANHIYYFDIVTIQRTSIITGTPIVQAYDIADVAETVSSPTQGTQIYFVRGTFCSRLTHAKNGASAGSYSIAFNGFDLTYT